MEDGREDGLSERRRSRTSQASKKKKKKEKKKALRHTGDNFVLWLDLYFRI
jgi:hypothetical protein